MMISKKMCAKLNEQIAAEFSAAHAYLAMACAFDQMGLKILAKKFLDQEAEEQEHAMKILRYVQEVGGKVALQDFHPPVDRFGQAQAASQLLHHSQAAPADPLALLGHCVVDVSGGQHRKWPAASLIFLFPLALNRAILNVHLKCLLTGVPGFAFQPLE